MKITKLTKALVLVTVACGVSAIGCELIVDFDRTKILVEATDATVTDGSSPEGSTGNPDASGSDASDAGDASDGNVADAPADAPADG